MSAASIGCWGWNRGIAAARTERAPSPLEGEGWGGGYVRIGNMPSVVARRLRTNMTDAERRLWTRLWRKQVAGHRFRRQVPIGRYVVDFACLSANLIVEVDGAHHDVDDVGEAARTDWLE